MDNIEISRLEQGAQIDALLHIINEQRIQIDTMLARLVSIEATAVAIYSDLSVAMAEGQGIGGVFKMFRGLK